MFRNAVLSLGILVLGASAALATGPRFEQVALEGYVDRAPEGANVIEQLEIGSGERSRTLLVTAAEVARTVEVCPSCEATLDVDGRFDLIGEGDDLDEILGAEAGTKVSGVFLRPRLDRQLVVRELETKKSEAVARR